MSLIPFDDRDGFIWMDGKMVTWRDAKVHVLTHGLHYGSCVFEGERAYAGTVFKLREHCERLHKSAELLGFTIPYSVAQIEQATRDVLAKQGIKDGYVRPVAWRGSEVMAVSAQKSKIHLAIAAWEWPSYFGGEVKERGLKLQVAKWKRPGPDMAPTASKAAGLYMICTLSKHAAEAEGFDDALMLDYRGYIAEATAANMFFVFGNELHTPTPDCFLNGITRLTTIELAQKRGIKVVERHIQLEELAQASEVFVTGSAAEVMPVGLIGDQRFAVGPVTKQLMSDYSARVLQPS